MSVRLDRQSEGPRQPEVSQFDVLARGVDQQILRLQVAVENSVLVQVNQGLQDLVQKALGLLLGQWLVALLLHVFLQVEFQVLKHQEELFLRVDDLLQSVSNTG